MALSQTYTLPLTLTHQGFVPNGNLAGYAPDMGHVQVQGSGVFSWLSVSAVGGGDLLRAGEAVTASLTLALPPFLAEGTYVDEIIVSGQNALSATLVVTAEMTANGLALNVAQKPVDLDAIMISEAYRSSAPIYPCQSGWSDWSWDPGTQTMVGNYNGRRPSFPPQAPPSAPASTYDRAKLTLSGQATLERQAFLATLELDSITASDLVSVTVDIQAVDDTGAVAGGFLITPTVPTLLGDLNGGGSLTGQPADCDPRRPGP